MDSYRISRVLHYSGTGLAVCCVSPTGLSPSAIVLSKTVRLRVDLLYGRPSTPLAPKRQWFGLFRVRSPLLAESLLFSFPAGTEMFQFSAFAYRTAVYRFNGGLPHSDICGSRDICSSPQLFAAYHVLLRLREPGHPPYALLRFPFSFFAFRSSSLVSFFSFSSSTVISRQPMITVHLSHRFRFSVSDVSASLCLRFEFFSLPPCQ